MRTAEQVTAAISGSNVRVPFRGADKGVSAMGQVVSLKMVLDPPGIMDR